jgi:hypothetical protein
MDEKSKAAYELWAIFYYLCETYDRLVCTGHKDCDGNAMPSNPSEQISINNHSKVVQAAVSQVSVELEIPTEILLNAKVEAAKLNYEGSKEVAWGSPIFVPVQNVYIYKNFNRQPSRD